MSIIPSFIGQRRSVLDPFSVDDWHPFQGVDSAFHYFRPFSSPDIYAFTNTFVDWKETPEAHVFKVDLPGVKKEEVKVEVKDGRVLKISGERGREKEEKDETWHLLERSSGKFVRRFLLPENAKPEEIKAQMEDGVLTVAIPKVEVKKPDVKAIEISG